MSSVFSEKQRHYVVYMFSRSLLDSQHSLGKSNEVFMVCIDIGQLYVNQQENLKKEWQEFLSCTQHKLKTNPSSLFCI